MNDDDEAAWKEIVSDAHRANLEWKKYCCPLCLKWYSTYEEKSKCLIEQHGYEILILEPKK